MNKEAYTFTVTKFNNIVKQIFSSEELLHGIQILGEVFGVSKSKSSIYFNIKDEESSLPCVCFYGELLGNIKEGDQVVVTGSPNFYAKSGRFNFVVSKIEPFGLGLLYQRFVEMKDKLEKEGLFDQAHKKPMPKVIKRIGVVTSKDGAVIQDIKNVSWRRDASVDIVLYDCKVQGNDAEKEIVNGINFFSNYDGVDVVVVARGGGSLEDLAAYNTEEVARAAYACQKPIVSAVGHEVDFTIIDFVSDLRAPTPSAAAELLTKDTKMSKETLKREITRIKHSLESYVVDKNMTYQTDKTSLLRLCENYLTDHKNSLKQLTSQLLNKLNAFILEEDYKLKLKFATINKLNPLDILRLGYAKIEQDGKPLSKSGEVVLGENLDINFADGKIVAKAEKKESL